MQNPELSIIIVNYNVKDFLHQALHSIQKATKSLNAEIIVVDNASKDGSVAMVHEDFPQVQTIVNTKNLGFAKANNQAIARAIGEFLVIINPDTLVQEDTFSMLLDFFYQHSQAGIAGCKILNPDGSLQLACRRSIPTPWIAFTKLVGLSALFPKSKWFGKYNLTYLNPDEITEVDAISGSFMMVRRAVVNRVGAFDEQFFMYGEDLDWCYRMKQAGWKIYYVPTTKIVHYKGESSQKIRLDTILLFYRAMLLFVRKHFRRKYLFFPQWFLILGIAIRAVVSFLHDLISRFRWQLIDLIVLNISLVLAILVRFSSLTYWRSYLIVAVIYSSVWLLSFYLFDIYEHRKFSIARTVAGVAAGLVINSAITYFAKNVAFSRLVVLLSGGFNLFLIPGWRLGLAKLINRSQHADRIWKSYFQRQAILVGDSGSVRRLLLKLNQQYKKDIEIAALLLTNGHSAAKNGSTEIPVLKELDQLPWYIRDLNVNEVIFSSEAIPYEKMLGLMADSQKLGVDFKVASGKMEVIIGSSNLDYLGDISLIDIEYRLGRAHYRFIKRSLDITLALFFLIVCSPVWFIMFTRGYRLKKVPVFVHSVNTESDAESSNNGKKYVLIFEKKGVRSHTFWHKYPILLQIIRGDFTFVGSEWTFRSQKRVDYVSPFHLKPGFTSLTKVMQERIKTADDAKRYEIYYLKNYSPWIDLEMLFKSFKKR